MRGRGCLSRPEDAVPKSYPLFRVLVTRFYRNTGQVSCSQAIRINRDTKVRQTANTRSPSRRIWPVVGRLRSLDRSHAKSVKLAPAGQCCNLPLDATPNPNGLSGDRGEGGSAGGGNHLLNGVANRVACICQKGSRDKSLQRGLSLVPRYRC